MYNFTERYAKKDYGILFRKKAAEVLFIKLLKLWSFIFFKRASK